MGLYMKSVLSAGHFDRIRKNIVVNSCTPCVAMAFHGCSHSRHLFVMAECPNHNSVVDATGELLADNTTEATDLMDSHSRNYQNKIQAQMTPQQTPAVSQGYRFYYFTWLLAWYNPQKLSWPGIADRDEMNSHTHASTIFLWTPQEMASNHRRQQLIREALSGKSPGAYAELFQR